MNLETERLIIRNFRESDTEDFFEYRSDPQVCRFHGVSAFTREKAEAIIDSVKDGRFDKPGETMRLAIELKSEKKVIGDFVSKPENSDAGTIEIGTTFSVKYGKKGYALEASVKIITHLFEEKNIRRMIAVMDIENAAAINLVEKLNFRREAEFKESFWDEIKNCWRDEFLYAMLAKDWDKNLK